MSNSCRFDCFRIEWADVLPTSAVQVAFIGLQVYVLRFVFFESFRFYGLRCALSRERYPASDQQVL